MPIPSPLCFDTDLTWEHAEGMNEPETGTGVKVFFKTPTISSYCNGLSGLLQQCMVLEQATTYCHGPRWPSCSGGLQNEQRHLYRLSCLWHRFVSKYHQGAGLPGTIYCWSSLNCAEAKGLQVTSFLRVWHWIPSHCGGQWHVLGPMHSPPFLHSWRQIAAQTSSQSLVTSQVITCTYYLHFRVPTRGWVLSIHNSRIIFTEYPSKINRILKKRSNQRQHKALQPQHALRCSDASQIDRKAWNTELSQHQSTSTQLSLFFPNLPF